MTVFGLKKDGVYIKYFLFLHHGEGQPKNVAIYKMAYERS